MNKQRIHISLLIASFLSGLSGEGAEREWHGQGNARWADLEIPRQGKTGFTLVSSEQTGINFTNTLDEWSSAGNRVLENGSGVAVGDFDNDGWPDIFFCSLTGRNALYRNLGGWKFENVTSGAGLNATNYACRGAVFADIDGDGWLDALVSTLGHGVICFVNNGKGKFTNMTPAAGTETRYGSMTLALADVDGNGTLDLYVSNYRTDDIRDQSRIPVQRINGKMVLPPFLQDRLILVPEGLQEYGEPDLLYLNDGKGHFSALSWTDGRFSDEAGQPLARQPLDWGLSATFRDINGDGFPDLYVCNDYWTPDRLWINDGWGRFRAVAQLAIRHTSENSMGVDFADIDRDGQMDFLVLDMLSRDSMRRKRQVLAQTKMPTRAGEIASRPQIMRNTLFHNRGDGTFAEIADFCGLPASGWSWQPVFIDVDLDGYEDLIIAAGHTRDVQDLDATMQIKSRQHAWPNDLDPKARQEAFTREMMEHARLYPRLPLPIVAFRNLGNLRFEEVTETWGTTALGVHQGIAFGDFDGDGDLDFVVNNLNGESGIYRNETIAPRVAVRLKGLSPNTQGIGAKIKLLGGAVPLQSQEVICGGRYLSGSEPLLTFAAGAATNGMAIEVTWRSGKRTRVSDLKPNCLWEIDEGEASERQGIGALEKPNPSAPGSKNDAPRSTLPRSDAPTLSGPHAPTIFEDRSVLLQHTHHEDPFDDYARQPLLPFKLSQLGPGVSWFDVDGDGWEDLLIGSGKGGTLAVYRYKVGHGFERVSDPLINSPVTRDQTTILGWSRANGQRLLLAGSANYEDGLAAGSGVRQYDLSGRTIDDSLPGQSSSTGPMALADIDGDGNLDLFIGGRVKPGRYPEPASSFIYRSDGKSWRLDTENSRELEGVGLVSGAVWSDLNGDGFPELILACEWGPIRVFRNQGGKLHEATQALGLDKFTGLWNGVTTGDVDGDGNLDIVAGNWGLNTPYRASPEQPLRLYYGDLMGRGIVDIIETEYDSRRRASVPRHRLDFMAAGLPLLRERFPTFKAFSETTIDEALGDLWGRASKVEVTTLATMVFFNRSDHFEAVALPREAQFAPAFSVLVSDFDGDGNEDIFLSQNFFDVHSEMHRLDAGRGLLLHGEGTGKLRAISGEDSGIKIYGEQRGAALCDYDTDGRVDLAVTQNGAETKLYHNVGAKQGLRVKLPGAPGNPQGIGAVVRLGFGERWGPAREIHAGSGYWSQDSAVPVMATPQATTRIQIRWPGGKTVTGNVPDQAREITVDLSGLVTVIH